jgi:hypothetical protein
MIYNTCKIQNITDAVLQLHEYEFQPDEIFTIEDDKRRGWASNADVLTAITNQQVVVHNADGAITDVSNAILHLQEKVTDDLKDENNRSYVVSKSQKPGYTTVFTSAGDDAGIGDGNMLAWDASITDAGYWLTNSDDASVPSGMKRHTCQIQFKDAVAIKEGTVYYMNASKGSYADMYLVCPHGQGFLYMGEVYANVSGSNLKVDHWLNRHPIQGDVPMGDELNTECCSQDIPSSLIFQLEVTVPESDVTSFGYFEMEIYRERTVDLDDDITSGAIVKL